MAFIKRKGDLLNLSNWQELKPVTSLYDLTIVLNNGNEVKLDQWKGKKLLLVNTASNCGYTGQYAELQKLYDSFKERLQIIAFPANDFKEQEKGSDEAIARFCSVNYGVQFTLAKKTSVVDGVQQNKVFQWLTNKEQNGWNDEQPPWNFTKYLVNEQGLLTNLFDPAISPLSTEVIDAILR
jgi:glutathione peroxidase